MTAVSRPNEFVAQGASAEAPVVGLPGAPHGGTSVELRDLSCVFGTVSALDGFSIDIAAGELVAMLGPSGCGKTTALRILAGFENASSGQVLVDGQDIGPVPAQKRNMGMVFQSYSLFPNMTVLENVAFGLRLRRVGRSERKAKAMALLEMVELADRAHRYPAPALRRATAAGGPGPRLAIEPRVLLLDEPLSALDAKVRVQLRDQIRALQRRLGHHNRLRDPRPGRGAVNGGPRRRSCGPASWNRWLRRRSCTTPPRPPSWPSSSAPMNRLPGKLVGSGRVSVLGRELGARGAAASGAPGTGGGRAGAARSPCARRLSMGPTGSSARRPSGAPSPGSTCCCGRTCR